MQQIEPTSVVIVRWPRGWVAHVRFDNERLNADISNTHKEYLYSAVERYVRSINNEV